MSPRKRPPGPSGRVQYLAVVRKEVLQTLRDRRIMFMLVAAPFIQTVVLGFAVNFDVDRVPAAVADMDRTPGSREYLRRLLADQTLRRVADAPSAEAAVAMLDTDRAAVAVVIPPRLEADLQAGRPAEVQLVVDGADPNRANVAAGAAQRFFGEVGQQLARERLARQGLPAPPRVVVAPRVLYNPSLETPPYIIPGILAMLLVIVTTIVTAMGLAREREVGTLEQVMVTPIHPLWLLAGKMTPFVAIGLFDVLLLLAAGTWIFGVPIRGNLLVLALGTLLYLFTTLGTGLLISTVSQTQQQAFLGGFLFILPAVLLSGIMTPIHSMPPWMQAVTLLNPLRYYAELSRGNLMKAAGLADLWPQFLALAVFGAAIFGLATLRFRKRMA